MKNLFLVLICSAFSLTLQAQKSETRTVGSFNAIDISGGFELVTIQQGDVEKVFIEAEGVDLEKIETKNNGNHLGIGMKKGSYNHGRIKITVTYKNISEINNSGSSDIMTAGPIKADEFEFNSSGSGDFKGEFNVADLEVNISGSCDMTLKGTADDQEYAISGSGDVDASTLKGKNAEVAISGSGDVMLNVSGNVSSAVSGSGKVRNKQ
ncbi:MAG: DUF2807 domain-containing protein [Saprospiraceae bacterium]|nr:DUF2807 domain-containing protein [Saprospiraceae bacterium]